MSGFYALAALASKFWRSKGAARETFWVEKWKKLHYAHKNLCLLFVCFNHEFLFNFNTSVIIGGGELFDQENTFWGTMQMLSHVSTSVSMMRLPPGLTKKTASKSIKTWIKGTGHDFFWSETPTNHLQRQCKMHINQKKQQNLHKIAEIMKKGAILAHFIL